VSFDIIFTHQAVKDAKKLSEGGLKAKAQGVIEILKDNPFRTRRLTKSWLEI
jgi:mRNA-degrading endonuclease RelE of RelBE toxin-antitoxin system